MLLTSCRTALWSGRTALAIGQTPRAPAMSTPAPPTSIGTSAARFRHGQSSSSQHTTIFPPITTILPRNTRCLKFPRITQGTLGAASRATLLPNHHAPTRLGSLFMGSRGIPWNFPWVFPWEVNEKVNTPGVRARPVSST